MNHEPRIPLSFSCPSSGTTTKTPTGVTVELEYYQLYFLCTIRLIRIALFEYFVRLIYEVENFTTHAFQGQEGQKIRNKIAILKERSTLIAHHDYVVHFEDEEGWNRHWLDDLVRTQNAMIHHVWNDPVYNRFGKWVTALGLQNIVDEFAKQLGGGMGRGSILFLPKPEGAFCVYYSAMCNQCDRTYDFYNTDRLSRYTHTYVCSDCGCWKVEILVINACSNHGLEFDPAA
jgi:hypothetical protein